ncbi:MAG: phosphate ABC transporter substrate-binding protein PstS family protein [Euryarchaeota archaeon]|nr:phosphate ABC transporter substrate-binding protein PstS family protein [Euryarchaeota archaeon]
MEKKHPLTIIVALAFVAVGLSGCTTGEYDPAVFGTATGGTLEEGQILQAGSSTVYPLAEVWADEFGAARDIKFSVGGGGSGAGATQLCNKEVDIGDLSRPMKDGEKAICRSNGVDPVEWTVAYDGVSIVVSKKNDFIEDLTVEQLHDIFIGTGHARSWNEVDPAFPDRPIHLCYPDADSGTYDYFVEAVLHGEDPRIGDGVQQSHDDNVLVTCLTGDANAIGFFGFAYLKANEGKVDAVKVEGVAPSFQTIADGTYSPLSRPVFMYTDGVPMDGILADYLSYVYHAEGGQRLIEPVGYVALDAAKVEEMLIRLGRA